VVSENFGEEHFLTRINADQRGSTRINADKSRSGKSVHGIHVLHPQIGVQNPLHILDPC
jgi:hypothetical protein